MEKALFFFWILVIGIIAFFTGEIATVMMLYLILMSLHAIHSTIKEFYVDWKRKNYR
ncbi:hypothetical protein [Virgibacillus sp. DJP39]|uniref:hypothetical protein n=1 Tax=Virgibacillus sp. DJP39 TaxID=3409790 RepID=UPI003BB53138